MLDWLRQEPQRDPTIILGGQAVPVVIRRHPSARRMTLRLSPDGREIRVTIPKWGRTAEALAFASSRRDWLEGQHTSLSQAEPVANGGTIRFCGEPLTVMHDLRAPRVPFLSDGFVTLGGPEASLARRLKRWLEGEAREHMAADLAHYCRIAAQDVPPLALSNARRRWGSCAPDGAIRINWRLIMAPDFVRRSVAAHEVAHLVHFDHSPRFHALLARIYEGEIAQANQWLKANGRSLYLPFG